MFLKLLGPILKFFGGGIVGEIGGKLNDRLQIRLDAKNDEDRLNTEKEIAILNSQKAILIEEQKSKLTSWIRPAIAAPFVLYLWKIVVWDKMLGLGSTPDLSTEQHAIMGVVIGAYFLTRPFEKRRRK